MLMPKINIERFKPEEVNAKSEIAKTKPRNEQGKFENAASLAVLFKDGRKLSDLLHGGNA